MAKHHSVAHHLRTYGIAGLLVLGSGNTLAGSFGLIEQSVSGMGTAYAVGSSGIGDASTVYFNPAGMTRLHGSHVSGGLQIVNLSTDFKKGSAKYNLPGSPLDGAPIDGKKKDNLDTTELVPSGYISHQYSDKVWFGMGVNVPFGLKTEYNGKWVGRYQAIKSELLTVNINPSIAFRFNDNVSFGFGLSAMYADGELTNKVDGGLALASVPPPNGPLGAPGSDDGFVKLTGDDWGYGFNAGILLEPTQNTRIGLHYRSEVDLTLDGHVKVSRLSHPALAAGNGRKSAKMDITLPDNVSVSGTYSLNTRWAFMGDVTWTQWSDIDKLKTKFKDGSPTSTSVWNYDDTFRYSLGTEYTPSRTWTFRMGVAYDETPVPRDSLRSPRVPGNDRTWVTLGTTYRYSPGLTFDLGYAHIFVDDPKLKNVNDNDGLHQVSGKYDASVDILGLQANWKFK